jgi:4-hydroxymandelate oxidase
VYRLVAGVAFGAKPVFNHQTPVRPASSLQEAPSPPPVLTLADYEAVARGRMSLMAYEYVVGGGGDEITLRDNHLAYDRIRLQPRILQDVSRLDLRLTLFGQQLEYPILLAPTAYHRIVHPDGELATVRGAADAGAILVASSFATTSIEDMGRAAKGGRLWFQLYVNRDRGFTRDLVQRAEAAGCQALCVTVDSPTTAFRYREARVRFALPEGIERANLKGLTAAGNVHRTTEGSIYNAVLDPSLTWKDIDWLRGMSKVPVLIKGVLNPDDASKGADAGVGIIVSNHGSRNLDTLPATIDALPRVVDAVKGRVPILVDGGIRRGTDVLKAIASGAAAILIGRPYLYGLAVDGPAGVARVVQMLRRELELAMAMTGRRSLAEIDRSVLWR